MIAGKIIRGNTAIIQIFVDNKTECQRKKYLRAHIQKKEGRRKIKETLKKPEKSYLQKYILAGSSNPGFIIEHRKK
jgi:hypothetical protein